MDSFNFADVTTIKSATRPNVKPAEKNTVKIKPKLSEYSILSKCKVTTWGLLTTRKSPNTRAKNTHINITNRDNNCITISRKYPTIQ